MSMQGRIGHAGGAKVKRALGVQAALEWAFRVEQAQLELPPPKNVIEEDYGFGLEYSCCNARRWAAKLTVVSTRWAVTPTPTPK
jgi:hypothetical protein